MDGRAQIFINEINRLIDEIQAINLISKHFLIAIQAFIQTASEKKFLNIWEKLGELGNENNEQDSEIPISRTPFRQRPTNQGPYNQTTNKPPYYALRNQPTSIQNQPSPHSDAPSRFTGKPSEKHMIRQIAFCGNLPITSENTEEATKNWEQGTTEPIQPQYLSPQDLHQQAYAD